MRLARKTEIQPTPTQLRMLLQHAGNARWAYNWGLRRKQEAWAVRKAAIESGVPAKEAPKVPTAIDLHRELNTLKNLPVEQGGVPWMYEASKCAPQEALRNLDLAFKNTFRRLKAGEKPGFPRWKSRNKGIGGFRLTGSIRVEQSVIVLPCIGRVRIKPGDHGYLPFGKHEQVSVRERAGRWFVSVLGPDTEEAQPNGKSEVGIDVGVVRLATVSDGTVIENSKALAKGLRKLKILQRSVARKVRGSANRRKARAKVARTHARVVNVRTDALHKATTFLAKSHGRIGVEDLDVRRMTASAAGTKENPGRDVRRKARLNRALHDASFGEFRRMLEYKAKLYGCKIVAVPPAYTSQKCSACGHVAAGNRRSQAVFVCLRCGFAANADDNAAVNIKVASSDAGSCPESINACRSGVRRSAFRSRVQSDLKQESA